jgi:hypothetical protein
MSRTNRRYRDGLRLVDQLSNSRFNSRFGTDPERISLAEQFEIAKGVEKQAPEFFELVRRHTL